MPGMRQRPAGGGPLSQRVVVPQREALMMGPPIARLRFPLGMAEECYALASPSVCHAIRVLQVLLDFSHQLLCVFAQLWVCCSAQRKLHSCECV